MTSTPGGKIAGGIIGGLVLAYLINKGYQYKKKENTNKEYQQEIDQKYVRKPYQVSTIQTLTESSINQPVFDDKLIQKIKNDLKSNRYLQNRQQIRSAFVNTKTTNSFYWEKPRYEKLYNIHEAEAKRIHEEEKKEAERIQEAAKLAVEKAAERAVEKAAERAVEKARHNQEVKEAAPSFQHPYTSVPGITNDDDDEFVNANLIPANRRQHPNFYKPVGPTAGSSKKSKKHKRRTRRRTKKN